MTDTTASPMSDDDIIARARTIQQERDAAAAAQKQEAASDLALLVNSPDFQTVFAACSAIHAKDTLDLQLAYLLSTMRDLAKRSGVAIAA